MSQLSNFFGDHQNLSCNVWYLDLHCTEQPSLRQYGTDNAMILMEGTSQHEQQAEKKLLTHEVENLRMKNKHELNDMEEVLKTGEENKQLKEPISLLDMKKEDSNSKLQKVNEELSKLQVERDSALKEVEELRKLLAERDNALKHALKEVEELRKQTTVQISSDFTVDELKIATDNFSDSLKISKGAYGCVYKGNLRGIVVAIKILNAQSLEFISAFKQEVAILTTARHPNLVTLIGACYEASALVYEFLPNGSLENHLNPSNNTVPLSWQLRTRIICEICLALIFLHSNKPSMVIHGDLKPDNVLLDANFVSKLGDFGISRFIQQSNTDATAFYMTYNPVGTPGYMDPEYVYTGKLTEKSDVFSLGVIILRLLTGEPASGLVFRAQEAMQNETFRKMIDVSAGEWPLERAMELASLALRCVEIRRIDRPNLFNEVWPIVERLRCNL